jgi:hypothetical protein
LGRENDMLAVCMILKDNHHEGMPVLTSKNQSMKICDGAAKSSINLDCREFYFKQSRIARTLKKQRWVYRIIISAELS